MQCRGARVVGPAEERRRANREAVRAQQGGQPFAVGREPFAGGGLPCAVGECRGDRVAGRAADRPGAEHVAQRDDPVGTGEHEACADAGG